jgi:hypothetical protein
MQSYDCHRRTHVEQLAHTEAGDDIRATPASIGTRRGSAPFSRF